MARTAARSPRRRAAGSSQSPGKASLREHAVGPRGQGLVLSLAKHEPVDLAILDPPDDVFLDTVAPVGVELLTQVVADAAGGDLGDQFGGAFDDNRPR